MFFGSGNYYYIIIGLQILCGIHSMRRGTLNRWIWYIVFLPLIGCGIYIYSEIIANRNIRAPKIDVGAVLNPGIKLKRLEEQVRFTDTFANRIKLADAYLNAGFTDKAVDIYTASLTGAFAENEHVLAQLIVAYSAQERYAEVIPIARKLYKLPQFARSKAHILYAIALENTGQASLAEDEFKLMKGRYSYFEPRYQYGLFLVRTGRAQDAYQVFTDILNEVPHLSAMERKSNQQWFSKTKDELKKLSTAQKTA